MDTPNNSSLTFRAGLPSVVELTGIRRLSSREAPDGAVRSQFEFDIDLKDDGKLLSTKVTIVVEGVAEGTEEVAFTVRSSVDCDYVFSQSQMEESFSDLDRLRFYCEPSYHRAMMLAQQMAWNMGYTAVRLPVMFPKKSLLSLVSEEGKLAVKASRASRKKTTQPKKAKKSSA